MHLLLINPNISTSVSALIDLGDIGGAGRPTAPWSDVRTTVGQLWVSGEPSRT
jgi:hypothetical protein